MAQPRPSARRTPGAFLTRALPPPALCGFLLLLVMAFAASYAVGAGAGPVAPGMHGTSTTDGGSGDGGSGDGHGGGGMDMGGMDTDQGSGR
ncbi:hypothetical protein ACIQPP_47410 [Streptomyces violaceusniger]|uniref:hypothetical protein n=1 Tax=Streptomyces violaceusniger TaxID=68280 RepID=UPI0009979C14|nr:hypothetical protein [Streptomyces hygroscopicus]AQW54966.1 hypothetical protein SHXM_08429 [Streptomyces hygroscopicus]